ncbi:unnamed protein product [Arctogadus glacialis]
MYTRGTAFKLDPIEMLYERRETLPQRISHYTANIRLVSFSRKVVPRNDRTHDTHVSLILHVHRRNAFTSRVFLAGALSKSDFSSHTRIHTFMAESTSKATARSSGAVRFWGGSLAQGHLDPPPREEPGIEPATFRLQVNAALPPELSRPRFMSSWTYVDVFPFVAYLLNFFCDGSLDGRQSVWLQGRGGGGGG